ncbi:MULTISPECIES: SAM-dependent methyltransferase [Prauserella salsuginis group]|uniref:SAM-dependent methyltransferase n=1 Tax=Prauserella salsuginis TaxID=387889 RepID=A0ABW6FXZ9_9PSEU|nr:MULTISPECIES: SAM-dependent methyltransferase [Prauserella salsuginis group]MCR3720156.1 S-adenosyl methyltransferase [Prauserella flava]MCR3734135.1 S-adenosyl methyltransferase [Prauserella salsuginis]
MPEERAAIDTDRPSAGRIYDYVLGGRHNYAVDREFAEQQLRELPQMRMGMVNNREFLRRAVRYAVESGIRQFVDVGSGLPTQGNVHEVADEVAPGECRVVYIDNEPIAHAHAQILLEDTADPERHYALFGDYFDGPELWQRVLDEGAIDPDEPICLLIVALLHFMPDEHQPGAPLAYYRDQLPPGSLLALTHISLNVEDNEVQDAFQTVAGQYTNRATLPLTQRSRDEIAGFVGDFEFVEPGLVWLPDWRPDTTNTTDAAESNIVGGVARKTKK